jgi:hypothetical protein
VKRSTIGIDPQTRHRNADIGPDCGCLDEVPSICKAAVDLRCATDLKAKAMTTFDKREDAFEKRFAHDEELKFKATARRNKLLGLWAAEKLGLTGAEADSYALSIVMLEFEQTGDHDVMHKIRKDFDAKGVAQSDHQISRTMTELMAKAVADIQAGK